MLTVSWRRWTSPIADSGREMDLPLRLLNGEMLYRDAHFIYPPFSPYFNAQLYRIFGAHLDTLHASGIILAVLVSFLCYRIARRLLSPAEASIATVGVIVWCVFKPAGNLISPYAFASLHGMIFALATLLVALRYAESGRRKELIVAGVLIGMAAITKQEFALAGAATVAATLIYLHRAKLKQLIADLSLAAIPAAIIALPIYGWLFHEVGWKTLVEDCHLFYTHLPASLVFYNSHRTGLDRPLFSFLQMLGGAAVGIAAASAIVMLSDRARKTWRTSGVVLAASLLAALAIRLIAGKQWDGSLLRALPLLLLAMIIVEWRRRSGADFSLCAQTEVCATFIIAVYSLAILARVALRVPSGGAFGGFFLPTSLILIFYLFIRVLPNGVGRWVGDQSSMRRARMIGCWLLVLLLMATAVVFSVRYRRNFNYEIVARRGHLFAPRVSGRAIDEALRFIERETRPDDPVVVLPEGSDLTFLTGRRMPLRHQILIPGLMSEEDEQAAIATLDQERVRHVLIVNRPMREFGAESFGRDYYVALGRWIDERYRLVEVCGAPREAKLEIGDPRFFIKILARAE